MNLEVRQMFDGATFGGSTAADLKDLAVRILTSAILQKDLFAPEVKTLLGGHFDPAN